MSSQVEILKYSHHCAFGLIGRYVTFKVNGVQHEGLFFIIIRYWYVEKLLPEIAHLAVVKSLGVILYLLLYLFGQSIL